MSTSCSPSSTSHVHLGNTEGHIFFFHFDVSILHSVQFITPYFPSLVRISEFGIGKIQTKTADWITSNLIVWKMSFLISHHLASFFSICWRFFLASDHFVLLKSSQVYQAVRSVGCQALSLGQQDTAPAGEMKGAQRILHFFSWSPEHTDREGSTF